MARQFNEIVRKLDWSLIIVYVILVFAGWFNIYSAVYDDSASSIFDINQKYGKQLIWIIIAFITATAILIMDSIVYFKFSYLFYILVMGMLLVVYFVAPEIKGARSWIEIGPLRFQPSEFAKMATSLVVARYLGGFGVKVEKLIDIVKASLWLLVPAGLIVLQGDAGTALVFASFFLVFYREGMPFTYILLGLGLALIFSLTIIWGSEVLSIISIAIVLLFFIIYGLDKRHKIPIPIMIACVLAFVVPISLYKFVGIQINQLIVFLIGFVLTIIPALLYWYKKKIATLFLVLIIGLLSVLASQSVGYVFNEIFEPHQRTRINTLFGLESDPQGAEFNVIQSKIAIGSGDFSGKGFLNGTQTKNDFVPEQSTDFIFCTIGEEWGFMGCLVIIGMFVYLILRIMRDAERQRTNFSRIYGYCVACIFFLHITINIGMTIGLMPVIGIPLPFFSYGGSSLWGFTMLLFIFIKLDVNRDEKIQ